MLFIAAIGLELGTEEAREGVPVDRYAGSDSPSKVEGE